MVEMCYTGRKHYLHPIIDWTEGDVWELIHERGLLYCQLYDEGFKRVGCIMCPFGHADQMRAQGERWPKYREAYVRAFGRMVEARAAKGRETYWPDGQAVMDWWLSDAAQEPAEQMAMEGMLA